MSPVYPSALITAMKKYPSLRRVVRVRKDSSTAPPWNGVNTLGTVCCPQRADPSFFVHSSPFPSLLPLNRRSLTRGDLVRLHGIIPAATYSRGTYRPTTIGAAAFHFRVRNGTGWDHRAVTTGLQSHLAFSKPTACPRSTSVLLCWRAAVGGLSFFLLSDCSLREPFKKADICVA